MIVNKKIEHKKIVGRRCESLVKLTIEAKTRYVVVNLNEETANHPVTDLLVTDEKTGSTYEISVKATPD